MKKILCPTDFSDAAHDAIAYAAKLCQSISAELILFHVESIFASSFSLTGGVDFKTASALQRLEAQSMEVTKAFRISCYAEVTATFQTLTHAIDNRAKDFDLIVMGTNGPTDIVSFFGGSHTYRTIQNANVPVLLVPAGCTFSEIESVVCPYDYVKEQHLQLDKLIPFIQALKCELTVLEVLEEAYSLEVERDVEEMQFILKSKYAKEIPLQFDTIRSSDIAQSIHSYVLRVQPDLLAICSERHSFLGRLFHKSTVKHLSVVADYPVLVYHP